MSRISFELLYSDDKYQALDLFLIWTNDFLEGLGVDSTTVDPDKAHTFVSNLRKESFPTIEGFDRASPFKKAGNLYTWLHSEDPFKSPLQSKDVGKDLANFQQNTASLVGFSIVKACLQNTTVAKRDGTSGELENEIAVSDHFFIDLVEASNRINPGDHFKVFSLLFEVLAYEANPGLSYKKSY